MTAAEALALARAQLSSAQRSAVEEILADIEKRAHMEMEYRGFQYKMANPDGNVLGHVVVRLRIAGWEIVAQPFASELNRSQIGGYALTLIPSQAAYAEAEEAERKRMAH